MLFYIFTNSKLKSEKYVRIEILKLSLIQSMINKKIIK